MQTNFFIDLTTYNAIGLMAGFDFMLVFAIATFIAAISRYSNVVLLHRFIRDRDETPVADPTALPAYRNEKSKRRN
ncbi:MAG: hypothetical protein AAFR27_13370 [Pseudomonadota bacterium]